MNWIEAAAQEISLCEGPTDKEKLTDIISRHALEAEKRTYCSYCGESQTETDPSRLERLIRWHILQCPQRPELRLIHIALAAKQVLELFEQKADAKEFGTAMAYLSAEIKKGKQLP